MSRFPTGSSGKKGGRQDSDDSDNPLLQEGSGSSEDGAAASAQPHLTSLPTRRINRSLTDVFNQSGSAAVSREDSHLLLPDAGTSKAASPALKRTGSGKIVSSRSGSAAALRSESAALIVGERTSSAGLFSLADEEGVGGKDELDDYRPSDDVPFPTQYEEEEEEEEEELIAAAAAATPLGSAQKLQTASATKTKVDNVNSRKWKQIIKNEALVYELKVELARCSQAGKQTEEEFKQIGTEEGEIIDKSYDRKKVKSELADQRSRGNSLEEIERFLKLSKKPNGFDKTIIIKAFEHLIAAEGLTNFQTGFKAYRKKIDLENQSKSRKLTRLEKEELDRLQTSRIITILGQLDENADGQIEYDEIISFLSHHTPGAIKTGFGVLVNEIKVIKNELVKKSYREGAIKKMGELLSRQQVQMFLPVDVAKARGGFSGQGASASSSVKTPSTASTSLTASAQASAPIGPLATAGRSTPSSTQRFSAPFSAGTKSGTASPTTVKGSIPAAGRKESSLTDVSKTQDIAFARQIEEKLNKQIAEYLEKQGIKDLGASSKVVKDLLEAQQAVITKETTDGNGNTVVVLKDSMISAINAANQKLKAIIDAQAALEKHITQKPVDKSANDALTAQVAQLQGFLEDARRKASSDKQLLQASEALLTEIRPKYQESKEKAEHLESENGRLRAEQLRLTMQAQKVQEDINAARAAKEAAEADKLALEEAFAERFRELAEKKQLEQAAFAERDGQLQQEMAALRDEAQRLREEKDEIAQRLADGMQEIADARRIKQELQQNIQTIELEFKKLIKSSIQKGAGLLGHDQAQSTAALDDSQNLAVFADAMLKSIDPSRQFVVPTPAQGEDPIQTKVKLFAAVILAIKEKVDSLRASKDNQAVAELEADLAKYKDQLEGMAQQLEKYKANFLQEKLTNIADLRKELSAHTVLVKFQTLSESSSDDELTLSPAANVKEISRKAAEILAEVEPFLLHPQVDVRGLIGALGRSDQSNIGQHLQAVEGLISNESQLLQGSKQYRQKYKAAAMEARKVMARTGDDRAKYKAVIKVLGELLGDSSQNVNKPDSRIDRTSADLNATYLELSTILAPDGVDLNTSLTQTNESIPDAIVGIIKRFEDNADVITQAAIDDILNPLLKEKQKNAELISQNAALMSQLQELQKQLSRVNPELSASAALAGNITMHNPQFESLYASALAKVIELENALITALAIPEITIKSSSSAHGSPSKETEKKLSTLGSSTGSSGSAEKDSTSSQSHKSSSPTSVGGLDNSATGNAATAAGKGTSSSPELPPSDHDQTVMLTVGLEMLDTTHNNGERQGTLASPYERIKSYAANPALESRVETATSNSDDESPSIEKRLEVIRQVVEKHIVAKSAGDHAIGKATAQTTPVLTSEENERLLTQYAKLVPPGTPRNITNVTEALAQKLQAVEAQLELMRLDITQHKSVVEASAQATSALFDPLNLGSADNSMLAQQEVQRFEEIEQGLCKLFVVYKIDGAEDILGKNPYQKLSKYVGDADVDDANKDPEFNIRLGLAVRAQEAINQFIAKLLRENQGLSNDNQTLSSDNGRLSQKLASLETRFQDVNDRFVVLGQEKDALAAEKQRLEADLAQREALIQQQLLEITTAQQATARAQDALRALQLEKDAVDAENLDIKRQRADIERDRDAVVAEREALKTENTRLLAELAAREQELADLTRTSKEEKGRLELANNGLQDDVRRLTQTVADLQAEILQHQYEIIQVRRQFTAKDDEIARQLLVIQDLQSRLQQAAQAKVDSDLTKDSEISSLATQLRAAEDRLAAMTEERDRLDVRNSSLATELRDLQARHDHEKQALTARIQDQESDLNQLRVEVGNLRVQLYDAAHGPAGTDSVQYQRILENIETKLADIFAGNNIYDARVAGNMGENDFGYIRNPDEVEGKRDAEYDPPYLPHARLLHNLFARRYHNSTPPLADRVRVINYGIQYLDELQKQRQQDAQRQPSPRSRGGLDDNDRSNLRAHEHPRGLGDRSGSGLRGHDDWRSDDNNYEDHDDEHDGDVSELEYQLRGLEEQMRDLRGQRVRPRRRGETIDPRRSEADLSQIEYHLATTLIEKGLGYKKHMPKTREDQKRIDESSYQKLSFVLDGQVWGDEPSFEQREDIIHEAIKLIRADEKIRPASHKLPRDRERMFERPAGLPREDDASSANASDLWAEREEEVENARGKPARKPKAAKPKEEPVRPPKRRAGRKAEESETEFEASDSGMDERPKNRNIRTKFGTNYDVIARATKSFFPSKYSKVRDIDDAAVIEMLKAPDQSFSDDRWKRKTQISLRDQEALIRSFARACEKILHVAATHMVDGQKLEDLGGDIFTRCVVREKRFINKNNLNLTKEQIRNMEADNEDILDSDEKAAFLIVCNIAKDPSGEVLQDNKGAINHDVFDPAFEYFAEHFRDMPEAILSDRRTDRHRSHSGQASTFDLVSGMKASIEQINLIDRPAPTTSARSGRPIGISGSRGGGRGAAGSGRPLLPSDEE